MQDIIKTRVLDILKQNFVDRKLNFTAYDVTKEVREKSSEVVEILHKDVKNIVHTFMKDLVNDGIWISEQDFNLHRLGPFVYKNVAVPAKQPVKVSAKSSSSNDKIFWSTTPCFSAKFNEKQIMVKPDKRGRICIPNKFIGMMRATPQYRGKPLSKYVYVNGDNNDCLIVSPLRNLSKPCLQRYLIDKYGNVRIARSVLKKSNLEDRKIRIETVHGMLRLCDYRNI